MTCRFMAAALTHFVLLVMLNSCGSAASRYTIAVADTETFNHNVYLLQSSAGEDYVLLSGRDSLAEDEPAQAGWEEIEHGCSYDLRLEEIEAPPVLRVILRGRLSALESYEICDNAFDSTADGGILLWSDGILRVPVYASSDVKGRWVRKNGR